MKHLVAVMMAVGLMGCASHPVAGPAYSYDSGYSYGATDPEKPHTHYGVVERIGVGDPGVMEIVEKKCPYERSSSWVKRKHHKAMDHDHMVIVEAARVQFIDVRLTGGDIMTVTQPFVEGEFFYPGDQVVVMGSGVMAHRIVRHEH